jgi:signal transduction histidine kinase
MHALLERQIRRYLGEHPETTLPPPGDAAWERLFNAIGESYEQLDRDLLLREQALNLTSEELNRRNDDLRRELTERTETEEALQREKGEQAALITRLEDAKRQLLYSEKMASIGQLAAGVAHEINNPVGFVQSNINTLAGYVEDLFALTDLLEEVATGLPDDSPLGRKIRENCERYDLEFLREDVPKLLSESRDGVSRVRKIVQDLRDFSHPDEGKFAWIDLNPGIVSTLNIVNNELKYKAEVITELGELPMIEANQNQLNQVFLNLLVNAAHAIKEKGVINVATRHLPESGEVCISIADTGAGIPPENLKRIFDPFFTTKPVGKGTGLGLSLSYGIVQKHHGRIEVDSQERAGTLFQVFLPIRQPAELAVEAGAAVPAAAGQQA